MKTKGRFLELAVLLGIFISIMAGYTLGSLLIVTRSPGSKYDVFGFPTLPPLTKLDVPPQTVNGVTATIEGAYADPSRVLFVIHLSAELGWTPETFLAHANGEQMGVYSGGFFSTPIPGEKRKYLAIFTPVD